MKDQATSRTIEMVQKDFEQDPMGLLNLRYEQPRTIVDLGAHVGMFTVLAAKIFPNAKIHAFEPMPINRTLLIHNLVDNQIQNFEIYEHAIAGRRCQLPLEAPDFNSGAASFAQGVFRRASAFDAITLDDVIGRIGPIDILKMDIEGMEYETLFNFTQWNMVKNLCLEVHGLFPYPRQLWEKAVKDFIADVSRKPFTGQLWVNEV